MEERHLEQDYPKRSKEGGGGMSDTQQFEAHFPAALAKTADPIRVIAPFLETTFTREGSRVRLEESSPSFP